jgi:quinol monooxygenase YgiN
MQPTAVTVLIEYRALPGEAERAIAGLERLVATVVREEPDCFGIRLLQDAGDPERLLLDEQWSSREAYLGPHLETPHLLEFIANAQGLFAGAPAIQFWRERSRPSKA